MAKSRDVFGTDEYYRALSRERLSTKATDALRALIQSGTLPPGTHLVESDLADRLGVSRGPIREALHHLAREHLVSVSLNRGAMVATWTLRDIADLHAVRGPLEVEAIAYAAERSAAPCTADLAALLVKWQVAAEGGQHERCADFDLTFHRTIWRHADNRFLFAALEQTLRPLQTVFYLNAKRFDDLREIVEIHERICGAVATGDAAVAHATMSEHMRYSLARILRQNER